MMGNDWIVRTMYGKAITRGFDVKKATAHQSNDVSMMGEELSGYCYWLFKNKELILRVSWWLSGKGLLATAGDGCRSLVWEESHISFQRSFMAVVPKL